MSDRIPFIYVSFDNSRAVQPGGTQPYKVLILGEATTGAKGEPGTLYSIKKEKDGKDLFGANSVLSQMISAFFLNNLSTPLYAIATSADKLDSVLNLIKDKQFNLIVNPFTDEASIKKLETDLDSRFKFDRQLESHVISAIGGESPETGWKSGSPHFTVLAIGEGSETKDPVWAAALAGIVAYEAQLDPARPFNTLKIEGVSPPPEEKRFERSRRAALLDAGFSTYTVDFSGSARVERLITTYKNPNVSRDESYLSLNTLLTLSYIRFSFVNYFAFKYSRVKLADDGAVVRPGSAMITPNIARCETIALFRAWEDAGLVEGFDEFKEDLHVERSRDDRSKLVITMSPRLVSQLNVLGANVSFMI